MRFSFPLAALCLLLLSSGEVLAVPAGSGDICAFLASHPVATDSSGTPVFPPGYVNLPLDKKRGDLDIDGDGKRDSITYSREGTANVDAYDIKLSSVRDERNAEFGARDPNQLQPPEFSAEDLDQGSVRQGQRWLRFDGRFYDIFFADSADYAEVEYARYFLPGGIYRYACIFHSRKHPDHWILTPGRTANRDAVCTTKALRQPKPVAPVARLTKAEARMVPLQAFAETHYDAACNSEDASCKDIWQVDFDNDGKPDRLLKVAAYSGSGRGCDLQKFLLLDRLDRPVGGTRQSLLENLPRECESRPSWERVGTRTVYRLEKPDSISLVQDGQAATLCSAAVKTATTVLYRDPALKK
jgi:hypothetical protein